MEKRHPYADATYLVIPIMAAFGVEVRIPDSEPTIVTPFSTAVDAERWIAEHRNRVSAASSLQRGRWANRPTTPRRDQHSQPSSA